MRTTSGIVPAGTVQLAAEWAGSGRPVVFLHAGVADRRMWRHQLAALGPDHRAIAFDRRGFGETPASGEAFSQTADLLAVLDHLAGRGTPAVLVGCSQGGSIAIDAALAAPSRFPALALIAPSVSGAPATAPTEDVHRLLDAIELAGRSGDLGRVNQLKAALWLDGPLAEEGRVRGPARELFLAMNAIISAAPAAGHVLHPAPAWDRLGEIAVPVRILCGDLDIPHIQERCRQLAVALHDARLEIMRGAAHLPSLEQPNRLTQRLLELLSDCASV